VDARGGFDVVHLWFEHFAFVRLSGRNLDAKDDTELVIDCRMLLVSRLQSSISPVRSHCGIGIGRADFLVFAGLPAASLGLDFLVSPILAQHILHMMLDQTVPA